MMKNNLIPPPKCGQSKQYDFCSLKKYGDSVFIESPKNNHSVRDAAYKYAKYNGFFVATRIDGNGIRIYHAGVKK